MVSLIIASLSAFALPTINGSLVTDSTSASTSLTTISVNAINHTQDGSNELLYYHVSIGNNDTGIDAISYANSYVLNINTSVGNLPLKINMEQYRRTNFTWYEVYMTYNSTDTYFSNMYLSNIKFTETSDGLISKYIQDVYFDGKSDIMDSTENATLGFDYSVSDEEWTLDFDLKLLPSNMVVPSSTYQDGYQEGYEFGYSDGYTDGTLNGDGGMYDSGYDTGYTQGYQDGIDDGNHYTFPSLFASVADTPVLIVRSLFNFDFFGVNMLTVVLSLFTAFILFYLLRKLF